MAPVDASAPEEGRGGGSATEANGAPENGGEEKEEGGTSALPEEAKERRREEEGVSIASENGVLSWPERIGIVDTPREATRPLGTPSSQADDSNDA
jgi:hypothetical protein